MAARTGPAGGEITLGSLVLPVYIPSFLLAAGSGILSTFLPLFLESLGAGLSTVALLVGIGSAGVLVFDLPSGFLVARFGERRALIASGLLIIAASLLVAGGRSLALVTIGVFLSYAGASFWILGRLSFLRSVLRTEQRGRGLATVGGLMRLGLLGGPIAGGYLAQSAGYRWAFFGIAVLATISMILFLASERGVDQVPRAAAAAPGKPPDLRSLLHGLRRCRGAFLTAGLSMLLLNIVRSGRSLVFPLWGSQLGLETSQIGLAAGVAAAADALMFLPAGIISDRLGRNWSAIGSFLVLAAGMAAVPITRTYASYLLVGVLAGMGNGLGSGINMTLGADLAEGSDTAVFLGLWRLVTDVGVAAAPLLISFAAGFLALGPVSLATAGIGLAGAAFHARFVKETLSRRRPDEAAPRETA
jgi:MFS family permease